MNLQQCELDNTYVVEKGLEHMEYQNYIIISEGLGMLCA